MIPCHRAINAAASRYAQTKSNADREALARAALPWCEVEAQKLSERVPVHYDDLLSAATFGLFDAIRKYDGTAQFTTYAKRRIGGAMLDDMRNLGTRSRVQQRKRMALDKAEHAARQAGTTVSEETIQSINGTDVSCIRDVSFVSMGAIKLSDNHPPAWLNEVINAVSTNDPALDDVDTRDLFRFVTKRLSRHGRLAVTLYFKDGMGMKEIGAALGLSMSRVSQLITEASKVMRSREPEVLAAAGVG